MKTRITLNGIAMLTVTLMGLTPCLGAGLLKPVNGPTEAVFMKSHRVNVTINNGFARTEVDQVFGNKADQDLEATYSFPVPKRASLSELSLWIDGREVVGEVLEKQEAKQIYEEQKRSGKQTALAEKDDYKTFDVKVYPVKAEAETRVRLVYYQPLEIDANIGRYVYPLAEGGVDDERIAFWSVDDKVHESFNFDLTLKSAFPVKDVRVPHYDARAVIEKVDGESESAQGGSTHRVSIASPEGDALTRDIVLYYRLADDVPARLELIPYREAGRPGTFMVVVTPAADLQRISEGTDWTFVLDVSGSMKGGKIATLCQGVSKVVKQMNPQDRYRIVTFNNQARDFTRGYISAAPANVQSTLHQVKQIRAGGGTNLFAGIWMAYQGLDEDRTSGVVVVTDGVANVGQTEHDQFLRLLKQYDIRLFTFVIGNSANQPLMDRLARDSGGFAMNISDSDDIIGRILQAKNKILYENMHDVQLYFSGEQVTDVTPRAMPNLYRGQQLVAFGRYAGADRVTVELSARISGQERTWQCTAELPKIDTDNPELERLWALSQIEDIMEGIREKGENERDKRGVIELGTEFSLVTDYTSMVVLDEAEMENRGIQGRNAERVRRERQAQQTRAQQPVQSYRVDTQPENNGSEGNQGMFHGKRSPGFGGGTGPVGPLFLGLLWWARKKTRSGLRPDQC